jgi:hypothetical protein
LSGGYPYGYYYGGYPYYSGYYGYPYSYGYAPYPYVYRSPVVIQQYYGYPDSAQAQSEPTPRSRQQTTPPERERQPNSASNSDRGQNFYLIAFNDRTIQAATAYKVDGDQFHWITRGGEQKQTPVSNVDVQFSRQLNRERRVDFQFP